MDTKQIILLVVIVTVVLLGYFGYIKPERKLTTLKIEQCIEYAINPIEEMIEESRVEGIYRSPTRVEAMKIDRKHRLENCMNNNFLLFPSEKNIFELDIDSLVREQDKELQKYIEKYEEIVARREERERTKELCAKREAEYEKYEECALSKNGIVWPLNPDEECLSIYNYKQFGVDEIDCTMIDFY